MKKHRALPGVRVFYQKISRKIIEALCKEEKKHRACLGSCGLAAGVRGEALCVGCGALCSGNR